MFEYLDYYDDWDEIINYLTKWKKEISDLSEINFDTNSIETFAEIKDLNPLVFRKLFSNNQIFNEIVLTLFPQKETLKLLYNYFLQKQETIYIRIADKLGKLI